MWVNHITNPGGEVMDAFGSVVGWRAVSSVVSQATSPVLDGTASVKLVADAAADSAAVPFVWPGNDHPVLFQAYVYHPATPGADTQLSIRTTAGASIAGIGTRNTSVATAWTRLIGTATPTTALVPGSAYWLYVRAGAAGTVYIDRAAVWQGGRDDALAWAAQAPLFMVDVAPGYGVSSLALSGALAPGGTAGTDTTYYERVPALWTDVTWRVRSGSWRGGRSAETEQMNAAEARVTLDNRDGALDPVAGTMGSVGMPMRIRYHDPSTGRILYLFEGNAWSVTPRRNGPNDQVVELGGVDRFKVAALTQWRPSALAEGLGTATAVDSLQRMANDLAFSFRTVTSIEFAPFTYMIAPGTAEVFAALDYAQTLARSTGGRLVDLPAAGTFIEAREVRYEASGTAATFGTATGEIPYSVVEPVADDAYLFNDWTVTGGGTAAPATATSTDATSGALYGYRAQSVDTRLASAVDVTDAAGFFAARYAAPRTRIPAIEPNMVQLGTVAPWGDVIEAFREGAFGGAAGGRVFVVKRPVLTSSGGTTTTVTVWPEGVSVAWDPSGVRVRLDVSPGPDAQWWVLDSSALDSTTRLAW